MKATNIQHGITPTHAVGLVVVGWCFGIFFSVPLLAYTDDNHYSHTFQEVRSFRVFTPQDYQTEDRRYPVVYYFHGCGGSYERSGPYSYADYGLTPPQVLNGLPDPAYAYANNADFENISSAQQVIIICVDGRLEDLPEDGCRVYFPSLGDTWNGNYYNFSRYIRELIEVVDARYKTLVGSEFRAVTGLSMGGHMATWIAATNPHLFSSASQFCHGPSFYEVGAPSYQTTVDLKELWRNLRGVPFRHTTADRDYLRYYTEELFHTFSGSGFGNEYYLAEHCHHAAVRFDLQIDFHQRYFGKKAEVNCFSHVNLYPDFDVWDYQVTSAKREGGWIYLHDVTSNGMGIYTRMHLPWGRPLDTFDIRVSTPSIYIPNSSYVIARYDYTSEEITTTAQSTDGTGRLMINSNGGRGEEIGIIGEHLQPPIIVLCDTTCELIHLPDGRPMVRRFEVVNLSPSAQKVDFHLKTEAEAAVTILKQPSQILIPALSKVFIDSFLMCVGQVEAGQSARSYISVECSIGGVSQDRTQIIPLEVYKSTLEISDHDVQMFDGRSETLPVFSYAWNKWDDPISSTTISEGQGNGNGAPEMGETFSLWIQPHVGYDARDISTWHPSIPIHSEADDFIIADILEHRFSTGREVRSAQIKLKREPTKAHPIHIPIRCEFLRVHPLENDCHRPTADDFEYYYGEVILEGNK